MIRSAGLVVIDISTGCSCQTGIGADSYVCPCGTPTRYIGIYVFRSCSRCRQSSIADCFRCHIMHTHSPSSYIRRYIVAVGAIPPCVAVNRRAEDVGEWLIHIAIRISNILHAADIVFRSLADEVGGVGELATLPDSVRDIAVVAPVIGAVCAGIADIGCDVSICAR